MAILLKVGDKVSFLKSTGYGKITAIQGIKCSVLDEFGFENWHSFEELVPLMVIDEEALFKTNTQKDLNTKQNNATKVPSPNKLKNWKIDLHIENLVDSNKGMSNHEILTLQLRHFKLFLQKSRDDRAHQILVVHGVGTGRLKQEIKEIVKGIKGAEMFDADYLSFGQGASIIEQKYNIR